MNVTYEHFYNITIIDSYHIPFISLFVTAIGFAKMLLIESKDIQLSHK